MDEMQNDLSQKIDNLQDSISRFANLNTVQEKENSPSQPYQNSMSIHEMEAQEGESSMVKEIEEVITLRSGKEVDLPTCKLEHKVESEADKEKRRKSKERKGKTKTKQKQGKTVQICNLCEINTLLQNRFRPQESIDLNGARFGFETKKLWPFEDDCANHERKCRTSIFLLLDTFLKHFLELKLFIPYLVSNLGKSGLQLRAPAEETMLPKETTKTEVKVLIQPIQEATTDASAPQDLTIT
ncbi:hypothetical protein AAG906_027200 [Vitis piasezkii]